MFAKSRTEKFVEQAQELAHDLTEAIAPHVERARDEITPRLTEARDQLAPRLNEARDQLAPRLEEARDQLTPHVEDVRDRVVKGVATATAAAAPVAVEARRRGVLAAAALKGEPVKKKSGKKKVVVLAGLAGLAGLAVQKFRGGDESSNWQTSYSPSPAAPTAGTHVAAVPSESTPVADNAGANPGESISDSTEEPHPVTLPDAPAEKVDVTDVKDPKP